MNGPQRHRGTEKNQEVLSRWSDLALATADAARKAPLLSVGFSVSPCLGGKTSSFQWFSPCQPHEMPDKMLKYNDLSRGMGSFRRIWQNRHRRPGSWG
jgi:hypothetical protein